MSMSLNTKSASNHRYEIAARGFPEDFQSMLDVGSYSKGLNPIRAAVLRDMTQIWNVHNLGKKKHHSRQRISVSSRDYDKSRVPDITADITALPFQTRSFPLVCCVDVLEHLSSSEERNKSISELVRISRNRVVLVFPYQTTETEEYEREQFYKIQELGISPNLACKQHREYGLPEYETVQKTIEFLGLPYEMTFHSLIQVYKAYYKAQLSLLLNPYAKVQDLKKTLMFFSRSASKFLNDIDFLADSQNSRRVRFIVFTDTEGVNKKHFTKPTLAEIPSLNDYLKLIPDKLPDAHIIQSLFVQMYTESMIYLNSCVLVRQN